MSASRQEVALLLSGGVDSSVALHRLLAAGHRVTAYYLKVWLEDELAHLGDCPWEEDLGFARAVCRQAGVDLEVVSLQREYHDRVVTSLLAALRAGSTPSPDVWCNHEIKLGAFVEALPHAPARVATGHYARLRRRGEEVELLAAADPVKDQTYFLCRLEQAQLARCLFPLGDLAKEEVRAEARRLALPNAERPDSQGICFLGRVRYPDFVAAHLGEKPGPVVEAETGAVLGEHRGHWYHTVGQRKGLGLSGGPWYVVGKDPATNRVRVSRQPLEVGDPRRVVVPAPHWIGPAPREERVTVKLRHGPERVPARLAAAPGGGLVATLERPDPGIAPGQWLVVYEGEVCRGGGVIAA